MKLMNSFRCIRFKDVARSSKSFEERKKKRRLKSRLSSKNRRQMPSSGLFSSLCKRVGMKTTNTCM